MRWQEAAFEEWAGRLTANIGPPFGRLLEALPRPQRIPWIRRLQGAPHPVAEGLAAWLSPRDGRPWAVVPGDDWEVIEDDAAVLMSYPEALGFDPVAMAALGALWAGVEADRWDILIRTLGAMAILSAWEGGLRSPGVLSRLPSFVRRYPSLASDDMMTRASGVDVGVDEDWPDLPDFQSYHEQLAFGVVPHDVAGGTVASECAVLLALQAMGDPNRVMMAGLAFKAMEGRWLMDTWQTVR